MLSQLTLKLQHSLLYIPYSKVLMNSSFLKFVTVHNGKFWKSVEYYLAVHLLLNLWLKSMYAGAEAKIFEKLEL
jgi:hypothetical protein